MHFAVIWLHQVKSLPLGNEATSQFEQAEVEMWQCIMSGIGHPHFVSKIHSFLLLLEFSSFRAKFAGVWILQNVLEEELEHSPLSAMCTDSLEITNFKFTEKFHTCVKLCEEKPCPVKLMNCLLDIGNILYANHVGKLFQTTHQVFHLINHCTEIPSVSLR